jgi:hypothetical protein
MRKILTTLAVTATALTLPMLASGTAYAAEITPVVPQLPAVGDTISLDASAVTDIVNRAIGGGCTTTFAGKVLGTGVGTLYNVTGYTVTIYGGAAIAYGFAQEGNTYGYVICLA